MLKTLNVIVLRSFMFGDSKMMADVLSREEGRLSCVVRVGSGKRARGQRQLFQPLSILELAVEQKSPTQLPQVREAHVGVAFSSIPFDPYKLSVSMFLAEFLSMVTRCGGEDAVLYDYVHESVRWLDGVSDGFSNFHLVFMMRVSRFAGFLPNLDDYREGCCFDLQSGCFVGWMPAQRGVLSAEDTRKLCLLMRMSYENMRFFRMSHTERNRCLDVILEFYRLHVPDFRELKSLPVLRELFA